MFSHVDPKALSSHIPGICSDYTLLWWSVADFLSLISVSLSLSLGPCLKEACENAVLFPGRHDYVQMNEDGGNLSARPSAQ